MLDFYLLSDEEKKPKPDKLDDLDFAGGLEINVFHRLVKKGVIDSRFHYYSDFRWRSQLIQQMTSKADKLNVDTDVKKLKEMLNKAAIKNSGLIALAD